MINSIILILLKTISFILALIAVLAPTLIAVAFLTLIERKVLASTQRRIGPNVVGILGLLQPFADAAKLIAKEIILPLHSNIIFFGYAPIALFTLSLSTFLVLPFGRYSVLADINLSILYIFAVSSLSVYSIIIAGWASNSRYAFLGALRAAAQLISYEVSLGLVLINVILIVGSFNLTDIVNFQEYIWLFIPLWPCMLLFLISALAETNRPPFDLPEAEGELVAGYNVEYSAMGFALFFIGEYANIIFLSSLSVILFFGGWLPLPMVLVDIFKLIVLPFYLEPVFSLIVTINFTHISQAFILAFKIVLMLLFFVWVRASFPRYRYDQLMRLGWKVLLPIALGFTILNASILYGFNILPIWE
jgi:NADH-quinone oxidoreductase subunit H